MFDCSADVGLARRSDPQKDPKSETSLLSLPLPLRGSWLRSWLTFLLFFCAGLLVVLGSLA